MKNKSLMKIFMIWIMGISVLTGLMMIPKQAVYAQADPSVIPESSPSLTADTPDATSTPIPPGTPTPFGKPVVVMDGYEGPGKSIPSGKSFNVSITITNHGYVQASNIMVSFTSGDFVARETGGIQAVQVLNPGESATIVQRLTATDAVSAKAVGSMTVNISYTDPEGTAYSNDSTVAFNVTGVATETSGSGYYTTATPTDDVRPQLVISSYQNDTNPLQPGTTFTLHLKVINAGSTTANNVTMVMGGGSGSNAPSTGTQQPGGVSGGSGEFSNFAPIESSNIQTLGDIQSGQVVDATQKLIVNVSTNPGAYSVKFSFIYKDKNGNDYQDDQVITLLVYRLPIVDINFYRTYDPLIIGMPGILPIQVVNLSRNSTVLGTIKVTAPSGTLSNNTMLVGALDAGGYFPLDVNFIPDAAGKTELSISLQYTDDFNQPREITTKLSVDVADTPSVELTPGTGGAGGGGEGIPVQETFWDKVVRFVKGLFGLDSGSTQPDTGKSTPVIPPANAVPYPGGKG